MIAISCACLGFIVSVDAKDKRLAEKERQLEELRIQSRLHLAETGFKAEDRLADNGRKWCERFAERERQWREQLDILREALADKRKQVEFLERQLDTPPSFCNTPPCSSPSRNSDDGA
ncbi:hypothetical protein PRIC1_014934 [Phytophthora ramorum]